MLNALITIKKKKMGNTLTCLNIISWRTGSCPKGRHCLPSLHSFHAHNGKNEGLDGSEVLLCPPLTLVWGQQG